MKKKFLSKINRNYFAVLSFTIIIIALAGYFSLRYIIYDNAKERLLERAYNIKEQILAKNTICSVYPSIEIKKTTKKLIQKSKFQQIFIQDDLENETEPYLEYRSQIKSGKYYYQIKIRQSYLENEDLISIISISMLMILIIAFGTAYFVNKKMNKALWSDFEQNLKKIEHFSLSDKQKFDLKASEIWEFDRLNTVMMHLSAKLRSEYKQLKNFTENAAHELQTPLSVIALNLEEILQKNLPETTLKKIYNSYQATKKLSALNKNLIFLTKIENEQFTDKMTINFNKIITENIENYSSLIYKMKLKVTIRQNEIFRLKINSQLAESLVSNLLSNAIKHNRVNGFVELNVNKYQFEICNSGANNNLSEIDIFNRFTKSQSNSFGLGLSIVKNICDTNSLRINYIQKDNKHCFRIRRLN